MNNTINETQITLEEANKEIKDIAIIAMMKVKYKEQEKDIHRREWKSLNAKMKQAKQEYFMYFKNSEKNKKKLFEKLYCYIKTLNTNIDEIQNNDKLTDEEKETKMNMIIEMLL